MQCRHSLIAGSEDHLVFQHTGRERVRKRNDIVLTITCGRRAWSAKNSVIAAQIPGARENQIQHVSTVHRWLCEARHQSDIQVSQDTVCRPLSLFCCLRRSWQSDEPSRLLRWLKPTNLVFCALNVLIQLVAFILGRTYLVQKVCYQIRDGQPGAELYCGPCGSVGSSGRAPVPLLNHQTHRDLQVRRHHQHHRQDREGKEPASPSDL